MGCRSKVADPFSTSGGNLKPPLNASLHEFWSDLACAEVCPGEVGRELERSRGLVAMMRFLFARRSKGEKLCVHNKGSFRVHA